MIQRADARATELPDSSPRTKDSTVKARVHPPLVTMCFPSLFTLTLLIPTPPVRESLAAQTLTGLEVASPGINVNSRDWVCLGKTMGSRSS